MRVTMKTTGAVMTVLVLFTGYLLHTPIPHGLVDTWQFRLIVAGTKASELCMAFASIVLPEIENLNVHFQRFFTEVAMSAPDKHVPGSNIVTRFEDFDGVRVLIYEPKQRGVDLIPGVVFCHGGGYAYGSTKLHGPVTRHIAEELEMVLISIEYRLAPEHPLPAASIDGVAATKYFLKHAADYGVDSSRVTIAGDSAGGHLAAVIVQHVHDDPVVPNIKLQVHFYPWIQCLDLNTPSYQLYEWHFGELGFSKPRVAEFVSYNVVQKSDSELERQLMSNLHMSEEFIKSPLYQQRLSHDIIFHKLKNASLVANSYKSVADDFTSSLRDSWESLLPVGLFAETFSDLYVSNFLPSIPFVSTSPAPTEVSYTPQEEFHPANDTLWLEIKDYFLDLRMAPLLREDFRDFPKAFIATGDLDIMRDDGIFYAHALEQAGVDVTWVNYEGAWHAIAAAGPIKDIPTGVKMIKDAIEFVKQNV